MRPTSSQSRCRDCPHARRYARNAAGFVLAKSPDSLSTALPLVAGTSDLCDAVPPHPQTASRNPASSIIAPTRVPMSLIMVRTRRLSIPACWRRPLDVDPGVLVLAPAPRSPNVGVQPVGSRRVGVEHFAIRPDPSLRLAELDEQVTPDGVLLRLHGVRPLVERRRVGERVSVRGERRLLRLR